MGGIHQCLPGMGWVGFSFPGQQPANPHANQVSVKGPRSIEMGSQIISTGSNVRWGLQSPLVMQQAGLHAAGTKRHAGAAPRAKVNIQNAAFPSWHFQLWGGFPFQSSRTFTLGYKSIWIGYILPAPSHPIEYFINIFLRLLPQVEECLETEHITHHSTKPTGKLSPTFSL